MIFIILFNFPYLERLTGIIFWDYYVSILIVTIHYRVDGAKGYPGLDATFGAKGQKGSPGITGLEGIKVIKEISFNR